MLESRLYAFTSGQSTPFSSLTQLVSECVSCYIQKALFDEAASAYERALAIQPDNAAAHIGRGDIYFKRGDMERAVSEYRKGLALEPDHAGAHLTMGLLYQKRGGQANAAQHFYKAGMFLLSREIEKTPLKHMSSCSRLATENSGSSSMMHCSLQSSKYKNTNG